MSYTLIIDNHASKQLLSIERKFSNKIIEAINKLKQTPRPHKCKKLQVEEGYRIRVGDYRILYTIDDNQKVVTVYRITKREDAYKSN
ncbi:MAG: hypothetical protein A2X61_07095 [Ignavibacteria bacterium GWB2_35_12]|nr:MAG: hypothetical protein A2X63_06225 [Ignavibacteria bacterium GWA2_35_8]OGU39243.1 MAG: hypothetical protein A2X61_07095 [Ignavibacteria bacterium GWB2_35_12]OGU88684.1 MAG: hypothetical protein A2220_00515 [Ignavibacteria bacterium RIFOXYA2_FULL_35_10]OGV23256.1 MAG: hypothetical protein A2475_13460 [Ignavibacteria bacterium RIFOXYC2_FULL_35_21]